MGPANLDGTGVNENFITGASAPIGVAVSLVPEPGTGLLVMGGLIGLAAIGRHKRGLPHQGGRQRCHAAIGSGAMKVSLRSSAPRYHRNERPRS
ncbi:MAG TPA: hypothetical protein DEP35_03595 [Deltaproteobacteria bacterium]|nr:hypothetical protein [Deltaproteobacteria bacterium]